MPDEIKNIKTGKKAIREFGILIGIILFIIAGVLFYKEKESFEIFIWLSVVIVSLGLMLPIILKPFYLIWMTSAAILGWFMTRFILSFFFYIVISPIGLTLRFFGKQFLELRWDKSKESYWNFRTNEHLQKENYEKQF
mgnify:CR=1 FL=1